MENKELNITIYNKEATFTEQLEAIIQQINEGYTSGYGWDIDDTKE